MKSPTKVEEKTNEDEREYSLVKWCGVKIRNGRVCEWSHDW
jgi:hypothetical protein